MNPNSNYQQYPPQPYNYPPQPYNYPPQNYLIHPDISNGSINQLSGLGKVGTTIDPKCNNDHPNYTKDRLPQGKRLDYDKWLVSQNQKFQSGIQEDGNLVIVSFNKYQPLCLFSSINKKKGDAPHRIQLNSNANLELQDYHNAKLWESDTLNQGEDPSFLIMQNSGNLALFDSKQNIIWSTNTICYLPNGGQPKYNNNHANYSKDRLKQGSRLEQDKWLVSKNQKYYAGVQQMATQQSLLVKTTVLIVVFDHQKPRKKEMFQLFITRRQWHLESLRQAQCHTMGQRHLKLRLGSLCSYYAK
ncbi:hypothetical protein ABPG72_009951 [Tetrahymena utriculariae]